MVHTIKEFKPLSHTPQLDVQFPTLSSTVIHL